jgi:hypothetical protein
MSLREDTVGGAVVVSVESTHSTDQNRQFGGRESQLLSLIYEKLLGTSKRPARAIPEVAETIALGIEVLEGGNVCIALGSIDTTSGEGHNGRIPSRCSGLLDGCITSEDNQISKGDLAAADPVELGFDRVQLDSTVSFKIPVT